jgi:hypothetical protein
VYEPVKEPVNGPLKEPVNGPVNGPATTRRPLADAPAATGGTLLGAAFPIWADVRRAPALFHFIDALAGTSPAKTVPAWQRQYAWAFGGLSDGDREQLQRFRDWRQRALKSIPGLSDQGLAVDAGSVPLMIFARGPDVETALANLATLMPAAEIAELRGVLSWFNRGHGVIWRGGAIAHDFVERAGRDPLRARLAGTLARCAAFYGVDPAGIPTPHVVLVPVLGGFGTHAQALGRYLLLEIREGDTLRDQAAVIVHENAHLLWNALGRARQRELEAAARAEGRAGARAWPLLREALPTALGQGIADRDLYGVTFSTNVPWYHLPDVDAYAKALAPLLDKALRTGGRLDEDFVRRAVRALPGDWK